MCAAIALPVRLLNSRRHDSSPPVPDFVSVAVKAPRALETSPFGVGVSLAATIAAAMCSVSAWLRAAAPPTAARANASAAAPANRWNLRSIGSPLVPGSPFAPLHVRYEALGGSDCGRRR